MFSQNPLCKLLGIKYPIIQGGMAWIAGGRLAAAVSNAGGLGIIGSGGRDLAWLDEQIRVAKSLTNNPIGVNLMLANEDINQKIELVIKHKIPVVTTGGGNPGKYIEHLKRNNTVVIPVVSSQALAKRLCRLGADAVIAEGMEAGGHVGEISTMCIVPMIADVVDKPVIAAGGIVDGRGFLAALALGAEGIQVGTRFVCSEECEVHLDYKHKIIKAKDRSTIVCGVSTGHPVRALANKFTREYLKLEYGGASQEELAQLGKGRYPNAALHGEVDAGTVLAGQGAGLVNKIQPAGEIVLDLVEDLAKVKQRLEG